MKQLAINLVSCVSCTIRANEGVHCAYNLLDAPPSIARQHLWYYHRPLPQNQSSQHIRRVQRASNNSDKEIVNEMADRTDSRPQGQHRQLPSGQDLAYSGSGMFARPASNRGGVAKRYALGRTNAKGKGENHTLKFHVNPYFGCMTANRFTNRETWIVQIK